MSDYPKTKTRPDLSQLQCDCYALEKTEQTLHDTVDLKIAGVRLQAKMTLKVKQQEIKSIQASAYQTDRHEIAPRRAQLLQDLQAGFYLDKFQLEHTKKKNQDLVKTNREQAQTIQDQAATIQKLRSQLSLRTATTGTRTTKLGLPPKPVKVKNSSKSKRRVPLGKISSNVLP